MDVTESPTWNQESPATPLIISPNHAARSRLVTAQGPTWKAGWAGALCQGKPSYPTEAPSRVPGTLMCSREHALNRPAGWLCGLPNRRPVPPFLSPPREAETCIGASLPAMGSPLPCLPHGPSGAPNAIAEENTQGGGSTEQESVRPGFHLPGIHPFSDHSWGN